MVIKVLVVDNSEVMREVLREAIESVGPFTVIEEAADGAEAIEIAQDLARSIDVVMMDMVMPNVDGVEATRRIKDIDPTIKVVFVTSVTQQERMKPAIKAGADGYITKPFENKTIVAAIKDVVT
jgi:two-component system chemotaxis response regulator CheY